MNVLVVLIPVALFLGLMSLLAFLWALKNGQFDDPDGAAARILNDDDIQPVVTKAIKPTKTKA